MTFALVCIGALLNLMLAEPIIGAFFTGAAQASSPTVSYTYDASGRLASVTTASGTASYHYDSEGNLLSITRTAAAHKTAKRRLPRAPHVTAATVKRHGSTVIIHGRGFSSVRQLNIVRIGGLDAPVRRASPTRLVVTAPPVTRGVVTVTTRGGTTKGPPVTLHKPSQRPVATGADLHPVRAPRGVTALSGLVEDNHGHPLPGVLMAIQSRRGGAQARARTDATGHFLLTHLSKGQHQLVIDGSQVGRGQSYGVYTEPVELPKGRTTVLPWITYLTPLDRAHTIEISSPTQRAITLTTPKIPGLEIQIPKGTVIRDWRGDVVHQLGITPLTVGRTPFPLAPGMQPDFFTLQPGDATVYGPGLRVTYPNGTGQPRGTAIPFFVNTPDWPGTGWWRYGTGYVSADGKQIIPAKGVHWSQISLGGYGTNPPPPNGPPPGGCGAGGGGAVGAGGDAPAPPGGPPSCPAGGAVGDPVDMSTGLDLNETTDLMLNDVWDVALNRTYRQNDDVVEDFGLGMSSSFNLYVVADGKGNFDLYMPDGGHITFAPTGTTGLYRAVGSPTSFVGATMSWTTSDLDGPFTVTMKNGTRLYFSNPAYLVQVTDRYGNTLNINRRELVSAPAGGQILNVTTPGGEWLKFTYGSCVTSSSSIECVTGVQDNLGRTLSYAYDANGRMISATNPAGGVTTYTWAACTGTLTCTEMLTATDPDGHTATNTYDPSTGRVTAQTDGAGNRSTYSYTTNTSGQLTSSTWTNPRGINTTYSFTNGYTTTITGAAGTSLAETDTMNYDPTSNLLASLTDPLGRKTTWTYDAEGNVLSQTLNAGTSSAATYTYTYEPTYNRITSIKDALGHTATISYNDTTHTQTRTDSLGHQWTIQFNNEGQATQVRDPLGNKTYISYLYGLPVAITNPLGQVSATYYDGVGEPLEVTDPAGDTSSESWSPLGLPTRETTPLGATTSFAYDKAGNLTSVTDANSHTTNFTYNGDSQILTRTDPLGHQYSYGYDSDGNLVSLSDPDGHADAFVYDDLDRVTAAKYAVSGSTAQRTITNTYDAGNRLTKSVDSATGTYSATYTAQDQLASQTTPQGTVSETFDLAGLPTTLTVPGQSQVSYAYDADGQLTGVTQGTSAVSLGYDADGRPTTLTLPDGVVRTTIYNAASEPTSLSFAHGSTQVGTLTYTYTADGQTASASGTLASQVLPAAVTNTYNAANELISSGGAAITYDADGNLTSDGTNAYTWNAQNQLTGISGGTTASFTYDPFGRLNSSTAGTTTTSYLYSGNDAVQAQSGGTVKANYLTGATGQIFQLTTPGGADSSFLTDPNNTTLALAGTTGQIATSYSYTPTGAATVSGAASPNVFDYKATATEPAGLAQMGLRTYSPASGRFISTDPTGFAGGTSDLYQYAQGDPINLSDPTGLGGCSSLCGGNHTSSWGGILASDIALGFAWIQQEWNQVWYESGLDNYLVTKWDRVHDFAASVFTPQNIKTGADAVVDWLFGKAAELLDMAEELQVAQWAKGTVNRMSNYINHWGSNGSSMGTQRQNAVNQSTCALGGKPGVDCSRY